MAELLEDLEEESMIEADQNYRRERAEAEEDRERRVRLRGSLSKRWFS